MKKSFDPPKRDRWGRLRFSVIGALMASPPEPGRLRDAVAALAPGAVRDDPETPAMGEDAAPPAAEDDSGLSVESTP